MAAYRKFGVIVIASLFTVLQELKLEIFRFFILYDDCQNSSFPLDTNKTETSFEDENVMDFLYKGRVINNLLAILPCIFLASWSDRHGRKLLLVLPIFGSLACDAFMLILLFVPSTPNELIFISEAVYGFCGGTVLMGIGCLSYLTDATDHRLRTWFISLFLGCINLTPTLGMLLQLFWTPFQIELQLYMLVLTLILIRLVMAICFLIYVKFVVPESVFTLGSYHGNPWKNLVTPINVSDTVSCVFKPRLDNMRLFIVSLSAIFLFYGVCLHGNIAILPKYIRSVFHWSYEDITILLGSTSIIQLSTLWLVTYTAVKGRIIDSTVGTTGCIVFVVSCLILSLTKHTIVCIIGILCGASSLLVPASTISMLSKLIERTETGSMYAGIGFLMLTSELISLPLYEVLRKICLVNEVPQLVFLLSVGFSMFGFLIFIYLRKNITPDLLGHLYGHESLSLLRRRLQFEQFYL